MIVQNELEKQGESCQCIRCHEIGHVQYKSGKTIDENKIKFTMDSYPASKGEELFLTYKETTNKALIGLVRMRNPSYNNRAMLVRELHVFGPTVTVGTKANEQQWQHRGWGEKLMNKAEEIASESYDATKISVLAGIGTRNYYRKFGYKRDGPYMSKELN